MTTILSDSRLRGRMLSDQGGVGGPHRAIRHVTVGWLDSELQIIIF